MQKTANKSKQEDAQHIFKKIDMSQFPAVKGYDFEKPFNFDEFMKSFLTTGIQATELGKAISITNTMIREKAPIFLSFTSNVISSGLRDSVRFLVKSKRVAVISTSAGGIEEDITQAFMPHRLGSFDAKGESLLDVGIGRIGNIYTHDEHYVKLEFFLERVFAEVTKRKGNGKESIITPSELCALMGEMIEKEQECDFKSTYLYWAYKNNIPVFCPGIVDGTIGNILYFYNNDAKHEKIVIDTAMDHKKIINYAMNLDKSAAIIIGGGTSKHYILNANIFKEGFDYAVYISTSQAFDASDSGGSQEEAVSWAKIKPNALRVKVYCEATIAFPLLVAGSFAKLN